MSTPQTNTGAPTPPTTTVVAAPDAATAPPKDVIPPAESAPPKEEPPKITAQTAKEHHVKREKPVYDFSDKEVALQLPLTQTQFMEVTILRPEREDYLSREKETKRVATVSSDRSMSSDDNEDEANANFITPLLLTGRHMDMSRTEPIKMYTAEELSKMTVEAKNRLLEKFGEFQFEVVEEKEDEAVDKLFETSAGRKLVIRQTIGDPDAPIFELFYDVKAPERPRRRIYLRDTFKVKRKTERKKTTLNTTFDMMKGVKLTEDIFMTVRGGKCNGKPSQECSKDEMMAEGVMDDMWKVGLADAAVGYFGDPEGK